MAAGGGIRVNWPSRQGGCADASLAQNLEKSSCVRQHSLRTVGTIIQGNPGNSMRHQRVCPPT
ncbi:hypothetical protein GLAREA_09127 [Glarea lozoyensis ATCC 20868]|uniref:Uncharacterized protein n=1 Tax=Glarea lozoyensis (strain ATCC 20868 / MF5171) TaxID=1116229 RepID=S3DIH6_GLAL2|nr:uncharacterized protein GLAREA_09127 [Glarea lozoyensis ATCC 20868]EPE36964.1 hypothetical protein GLAREA_09127 [Glarea lozoyensis ATCC 20868]